MSYCLYCGAVGGGGHNTYCPLDPIVIAERHHEVLCLVLKTIIADGCALNVLGKSTPEEVVGMARVYADLAYPPPKQEQP